MHRLVFSTADFQAFASPLIGLPVSHIWNGYGSAIFLEFGALTPSTSRRRDGSLKNPKGEFTLMIEWSWRIEGKRLIWGGSWSESERWMRLLARLKDTKVVAVSLIGRLPEIDVALSNGLHLASYMTAEGDPEWALLSRRGSELISMSVRAGRLVQTIEIPDSR
jgi:hypothetical protein